MFLVLFILVFLVMMAPMFFQIAKVGAILLVIIWAIWVAGNYKPSETPQQRRRRELLGDDPELW